ncbi:MAG: DUF1801 domain-containing protein [Chitinophagaceae bacterium]|nr:DUF1801 domain-containing protein [Chitinophagaceae bacterium]MBL0056998.1 DUF1801 domain-containing protein [Chitinophagaceae bacterium]
MNEINPIDAYIASFPQSTQKKLQQIRMAIRSTAPEAAECINYGIPTFTLYGNLVHFAGYTHHIGFYPGAGAIKTFQQEIKDYKTSKGTIQFPLDKPLPIGLVKKITRFRIQDSRMKAEISKRIRTCPNGHTFYKSSSCNTCPTCERENKPVAGFLSLLAAPARRALVNKGISGLEQLARLSETELLALHGIGPASLPVLKKALKDAGMGFTKK